MRPSRQSSENPVSFFSFQDVMMCTIGVTIVITMVLILQVGSAAKVVEAEVAQSKVDVGKSRAELASAAGVLKQRLDRLAQTHSPNQAMVRGALRQDLRSELERRERVTTEKQKTEEKVREMVALSSADPSAIEAAELIRQRDELELSLIHISEPTRPY